MEWKLLYIDLCLTLCLELLVNILLQFKKINDKKMKKMNSDIIQKFLSPWWKLESHTEMMKIYG